MSNQNTKNNDEISVADKKLTIVTHSSGFHTDDIFAVATLSLLLDKEGRDYTIVRSRDMDVIGAADYVVDVGGEYDIPRNRFDHHQKGGAGERENGVPYASFGLVWKTYGEKVSGNKIVSDKIDKMIVQPVDFIDTGKKGMEILETSVTDLHPFDISLIKDFFAPTWKEDVSKMDEIFMNLVSYAKVLLDRMIISMRDGVEGEEKLLDIYNNTEDKRIIVMDNSKYRWEEFFSKKSEPIYVVYENRSEKTWSVKCVRDNLWSYETRKALPEAWAGKKDKELEDVSGVVGAKFCHNSRFMAVASTKEAVLKLAQIALNS